MADNVYKGGVPQGGFDANMKGAGFGVSNEGESSAIPGGPAERPGVVNQGGATEGKTYSKSASEAFLMDSSYKTSMEVGRPGAGKTINPDDLSQADSC
jgi:hypothetical protein